MENPSITGLSNFGANAYGLPPINWNPKDVTIELIVTMVLVRVGMGPLEQSMKNVVNDQKIQNQVDADMIQFSNLVSEIETASKADGTNVPDLQAQLQTMVKNLFGANAKTETVNGQTFIVPDPKSDLGKFITMLQDNNGSGYDYHNDPVFDLLNNVGTYLFGTTVSGEVQTPNTNNWTSETCPNNIWNTIMGTNANGTPNPNAKSDFQKMINCMGSNHWLSENPGTKNGNGNTISPGTAYLSTQYNQTSGAQSGLQGMGSQNTALIQTDSSSENSLDQTGQNILNSANSLKIYLLQQAGGA